MLKIMHGNKFFSVFLLTAITIMLTVAFVFWGIGPKDSQTSSYVAKINDEKITLDQFWRAYDNEYKRLRDQEKTPEEIKKLKLEDQVLNALVNNKVLLIAAQMAGLTVTDHELQKNIMNTAYFQKGGVFNKRIYERALKLSRMSPGSYEDSVRGSILISKMTRMIGETAEVTPDEEKILESMEPDQRDQLKGIFSKSKVNQAVQAYIAGVKRQIDIDIKRDLIS